jgi:hypothetical protein
MKNRLGFLIYLLSIYGLMSTKGMAQDDKIKIKDLQVPSTPAFILLDAAPTSIEHPTTAKALGLNLINAVQQAGGFPTNFGLEVTPFWYTRPKNLTPEFFYGLKEKNGVWKNNPFGQAKFSAFSLASVNKTDSITKKNSNFISIGFHSTLINIPRKGTVDKLNNYLSELRDQIDSLNIIFAGQPADVQQEILNKIAKLKNPPAENILKLMEQKPLFTLGAAIGYATAFEDNDVDNRSQGRFGGWLTASLSLPLDEENTNYFNLLALGRYLDNNYLMVEGKSTTYADFGGKGEFQFKRFWIGYELIKRFDQSNSKFNTSRSAGLIKFKISDNIYINGTFGKNFGKSNNLIALLGINFGIGNGTESLDNNTQVKP